MRGLILSAGLGERLRPLTNQRAKPSIEFLNVPMLAFPYYWLDTVGLRDVVFNTHYLPDTVRHAAMHVVDPGVPLHFTHEPVILGSGGGIAGARMYLEGERTFAVANADAAVLFEEHDTMKQMLEFHERKDALATMLVCPLEGVGTRSPGVWLDSHGEVANFGLKASRPYLHCLHYASIMFISARIWDYLPDGPSNILYDVFAARIADGEKVYGFEPPRMCWFETGNAADFLGATRECLQMMSDPGSRLGASARQIVERHGPPMSQRGDFALRRLIADTAEIADNARFEGFAVIGDRARIENAARLHDSVVLSAAVVASGTSAKESIFS